MARTADESLGVRDPDTREMFLELLRGPSYGQVAMAAQQLNLSVTQLYRERKADAVFKADWDDAVEEGKRSYLPALEAAAFQRATEGYALPVYLAEWIPDAKASLARNPMEALAMSRVGKNVVGWQQVKPSDLLLIFLMKAANRRKYDPPKETVNTTVNLDALAAEVAAEAAKDGHSYDPEEIRQGILAAAERARQKLLPSAIVEEVEP